MTSIYKRRDVLLELREMILPICSDIHTSNRETVKTTKTQFVIIKMPQGISPYADTHNTAYVQIHLFVKDIANGVESVEKMESLVEQVSSLFPFSSDLMSCNETPLLLESKPDGMGYHSSVLQFRITIKR